MKESNSYWTKYVTNCVTPTFTEQLFLAADKEIAELKANSIPRKKVEALREKLIQMVNFDYPRREFVLEVEKLLEEMNPFDMGDIAAKAFK